MVNGKPVTLPVAQALRIGRADSLYSTIPCPCGRPPAGAVSPVKLIETRSLYCSFWQFDLPTNTA